MKKLLLTSIAFILIFALFGGANCMALDIAVAELVFSSLEELLVAHKAVKEGTAGTELAALAESVNFAELDEFYFPTGIPDAYKLYKISITYGTVSYVYLLEQDMISDAAIRDAISQRKEFDFGFYRGDPDMPMTMAVILEQYDATEKDLIGGIYWFDGVRRLVWGSETTVLSLHMPLLLSNGKDKDKIKFAAVDAVDIETGERQPYSPPVLYVRCWQKAPSWVQWILRYICFGWIWMK